MERINLTIPSELKRRMRKHEEINWSGVAAKAFERQLRAQEILDRFREEGVSEEEAVQRGLRLRHREEVAKKQAG